MCPEEVVKCPNLSAETSNTTTHEGSRDSLLLAGEKLTALVQNGK